MYPSCWTLTAIESDAKREEVRVHSFNAVTRELQLSSPLKYNHQGSILIRHRDFFPVLFRSARDEISGEQENVIRLSAGWHDHLELLDDLVLLL